MSIAKILEVSAEGKSIEAAIEDAVKSTSKSVRNVQSVYVDGIQAVVKKGKVSKYRANCKVTFVVE